jgi:hypothetical protein
VSEKACLVIAPIGDPESDTRRRSDQILVHLIRPAASECGYCAVRADEIAEPGLITNTVIQRIVSDPLVIADLTDRNPNVFYELALRHALRRPLVQIIRKGDTIPFDVAGMRTISVDHHDLDSVQDARLAIVKQIRGIEKADAPIETPISVALELQQLRGSDNPEQRTLGELLATIAELRTAIAAIEKSAPKIPIISQQEIFDYIQLAAIAARQTDAMEPSRLQEVTTRLKRSHLAWGHRQDVYSLLFAPSRNEKEAEPVSSGSKCAL